MLHVQGLTCLHISVIIVHSSTFSSPFIMCIATLGKVILCWYYNNTASCRDYSLWGCRVLGMDPNIFFHYAPADTYIFFQLLGYQMGFAVRVRSAGQKYGPTCHQSDRADVTEFVTLVRLSSLGQHVGVLALAGYKRRKSALAAGPIIYFTFTLERTFFFSVCNYLFQQLAAANYLFNYHLLALKYLFQKHPRPSRLNGSPLRAHVPRASSQPNCRPHAAAQLPFSLRETVDSETRPILSSQRAVDPF